MSGEWSIQPNLGARRVGFNAARHVEACTGSGGWLLGDPMGRYVYVHTLSSGPPVTATFGADGDEAPQRVRVDQRG
jgi:hypothetical protein